MGASRYLFACVVMFLPWGFQAPFADAVTDVTSTTADPNPFDPIDEEAATFKGISKRSMAAVATIPSQRVSCFSGML